MICPHCDASAWLIEVSEPEGPEYFQLVDDDNWSSDHDTALHFARKQDAEKYIADVGWTRARAIEHIWPASPPEQAASPKNLLRGRESVREIAHKHCTCTCRGDPEVLQNHTNLCDEISDAILEYAVLSSAPQRSSTSAMHDLICAIIEDDAKYDATTNTWDTSKAATAIIAAFDGEPTTQSNIGR